VISIYCHDLAIDVEEDRGRIKVIFGKTGNNIVIWLDIEKADKLRSSLDIILFDKLVRANAKAKGISVEEEITGRKVEVK